MKLLNHYKQLSKWGIMGLTGFMLTFASVPMTYADTVSTISAPLDTQANLEAPFEVTHHEALILYDVAPQVIEGVTMIPLKLTLDKLGYEVTWDGDLQQITISKGAQYTSMTIGENRYFKNKMAPVALSHSPLVVEGRTLVPAEFFTDILDLGIEINQNQVTFNDDTNGYESGVVQAIEKKEDGSILYTIGPSLEETGMEVITLLTVYPDRTIMQKDVQVGDTIHAVTPPIRLMIIPAQTSAMIIY